MSVERVVASCCQISTHTQAGRQVVGAHVAVHTHRSDGV